MAADDLLRTANILAKRIERLRIDGGDPRDSVSDGVTRFRGYPFPQDKPRTHTGWIVPMSITPVLNSFQTLSVLLSLAYPRQSLENTVLSGIYPLATVSNPFGVFQTMSRYTYEDLHLEIGGGEFADTDADAYYLGPSTYPTHSGLRQLNVDITNIQFGEAETLGGGTPIVYFECTMNVKIPPD